MTGIEIDIETKIGDQVGMQNLTGSAGEALAETGMASSLGMVSKVEKQIKVILRSLKRIKEELLLD